MMNKEPKAKIGNDYYSRVGKTILHLTHQNKTYFPREGITKGDLIHYYNEIAELILPYIKNRPEAMNHFPNGIALPSFHQTNIDTDTIPTWVKTKKIFSESNNTTANYLICNNKETLLYMANLGCIEINPWNSTIQHIDNPDWLIIDLVSDIKNFNNVIETALTIKKVMDEFDIDCLCKTSGLNGLHIYIPLGAQYDYSSIKILGKIIANEVNLRLPNSTTLERSLKKRNHKIYIDYLQNKIGNTITAPYSVSSKPGATVSTPLEWYEVNQTLDPSQFTLKKAIKRFDKKGDLWKPVLSKGANIKKIIKKLEYQMA